MQNGADRLDLTRPRAPPMRLTPRRCFPTAARQSFAASQLTGQRDRV